MNRQISLIITAITLIIGQIGFAFGVTALGITATAAALPFLLPAVTQLLRERNRRTLRGLRTQPA